MGDEKEKTYLKVKVFWRPEAQKQNFEGEAIAVSSKNQLGNFDILPGHTNFITFIFRELTIHLDKKKKISLKFERGILEVSENNVNIFLGL
jgi:F0F1-type ATP synthase epsilon subunit